MAIREETPALPVTELVTGHFRERAGYAVHRTRGTPDWLLIYTRSGLGRFGYDTGQLIVSRGAMVLLKPHTLHDYGVETTRQQWELQWAHFYPRPAWLEWLNWPEVAPGLLHLQIAHPLLRRQIENRLDETHRYAAGAQRRRGSFAMNALEDILLQCDTVNPRQEQSHIDDRIRAAMDYLCQNISLEISLKTLAAHSGLSVSRLAHLFRAHVGATPQQFLELQRINRAKQLLELSPHSIKEIAHEVGFQNPFYFTLRFKHHTNQSPREYRRKLQH